MLEVLAAATGVELGKLILDQVLNLGKSAMEDYVKDFFKDCIQSGVAQANSETLKKPMAEAIGFFIRRFIKELLFFDVPESSIEHHFKAVIKRFVQDEAVRPILGKAFEKDCKQIDYSQLQQIWAQKYQVPEWHFPTEEFDWRGVAKEYVVEVKGIIKANAELRSLLDTELLEEIARNTAQLSPGFDVAKYRKSLQTSYGYLKLYTLDSTDRADTIKLWNMFIEQTVREALPPTRYELPLDLKRQLQEQGQLDDLSPEALEHYRREYFQQPARKVLETVAKTHHAVILGDPGSGKSTLLQYLALDWVEGKTETLPLLIELREYVMAQSANFLDFLHRGRGADWQFDEQQLHQYLSDSPSFVMFDGLDEVFDRPTQAVIVDDIIRFAQQYPQAKVLVTSRIIGYNPERFQHAGFLQFTIQPLDETEIYEFIDRWYDLAMGSDLDKGRLKQRLKNAIANSKAIENLADSPLMLTMMAILNRRQELPRDRVDLYDQASRVLLYHWDVDHKRLHLPMDAIGRREKQEMLRLIAYEMQAGEEGLKGNLIGVNRLTQILMNYLRDQGFSEPREKANILIQQLRERNFILCYRGADTYGFVHRTFLEYFCASEIVNRFEKVRSISIEQLQDEIFEKYWQDESWREVLRLICREISDKFAVSVARKLAFLDGEKYEFENLFLAVSLLEEVEKIELFDSVVLEIAALLMPLIEYCPGYNYEPYEGKKSEFVREIRGKSAYSIGSIASRINQDFGLSKYQNSTLDIVVTVGLRKLFQNEYSLNFKILVVEDDVTLRTALKRYLHNRKFIVDCAFNGQESLEMIANHEYDIVIMDIAMPVMDGFEACSRIVRYSPSAISSRDGQKKRPWIIALAARGSRLECLTAGMDDHLRKPFEPNFLIQAIYNLHNIETMLKGINELKDLSSLKEIALRQKNANERLVLFRLIAHHFSRDEEAIYPILIDIFKSESDHIVQWVMLKIILDLFADKFGCDLDIVSTLHKAVLNDSLEHKSLLKPNPRQTILETLLTYYPPHPKMVALLRDCALNYPDEQLREWAQQQLEELEIS